MERIAILLATYNGAKFLPEQLESLVNQSYTNWILYVRDDGSKDESLKIIKDFKARFPQQVVILENSSTNLGAKNSFVKLLENAEEKYIMFCDQDDVWLEDKISATFNQLKETEQKNPDKGILVFCDAVVTDQNLKTLVPSFWQSTRISPEALNKGKMFEVFNCAPGCTMMINSPLKPYLFPFPDKAPMHDWWIAIAAQRHGIIQPVNKTLMLYRQHGANTIGAEKITKNYFLNKFSRLSDTVAVQKKHLEFLNEIGGLDPVNFYWLKIKLNLQRFFR